MAATPRPLFLATFNPHNRAASLTGFLADVDKKVRAGDLPGTPDRVTLCEVGGLFDELPKIAARFGYRVHQETPIADARVKPEHGSTATLTRVKTFKPSGSAVDPMTRRWEVFSHSRVHAPRRWQRVVGSVAEAAVSRGVFISAHGPTNGIDGANRTAYAEAVTSWRRTMIATRPGTLAVVDGDLNDQAGDLRKWATGALPVLLGVKIVGHSVDVIMVRGADVRQTVLGSYGSDHAAVYWVVTPRAKLREQIAKARKKARK